MSPVRKYIAVLIVLSSLAAAGCSSSEGRERTSRVRAAPDMAKTNSTVKRPDKTPARAAPGRMDGAVSTPEDSIQRDLARLKEQERNQRKSLEEMHSGLSQAEGIIQQERQKLEQIQVQISSHEMALAKLNGAPAANAAGRGFANQPAPSYNEISAAQLGGYPDNGYQGEAQGEVTLFNGNQFAQPAPSRYDSFGPQPYAGAPARQQNVPPPASRHQSAPGMGYEAPPSLFSDNVGNSGPQVPVRRQTAPARPQPIVQEMPLPAPARQVQPQQAQTIQTTPIRVQPLNSNPQEKLEMPSPFTSGQGVSVPAAGATARNDDVFIPDLFLSGNR